MSQAMMVDAYFAPKAGIQWKHGQKQAVHRYDYNVITATTKSDTKYEFHLPNSHAVVFGRESGFLVSGVFQCKNAVTAAEANPQWDTVPLADYSTCVVQPNWFDHLVKSVDVYHNNLVVNPHNVPAVDPLLNTYLYSVMDPGVKRILCPEDCNPGNAIPANLTDWTTTQDSGWHKYSKTIFNNKNVMFKYVPLLTFPFHQEPNFSQLDTGTALPLPMMGIFKINVRLHEDPSIIFKKAAGNDKSYRFKITNIELVVQEATLSNPFDRTFHQSKRIHHFPGVTKLGSLENFNAGINTARFRFPDIPYPEGIFVMALNKKAAGGDYKYSDAASTSGALFVQHNIKNIEVKFGNNYLANKVPNLGTLNNHIVEIKQMLDHLTNPPFGIHQAFDKVTLANIKEGSKNTVFPHIYMSLCPSGKESRIVPVTDDGSSVNRDGDISLEIEFYSEGAPQDAVFIFYAFYTDRNMKLDLKEKSFQPEYHIKA